MESLTTILIILFQTLLNIGLGLIIWKYQQNVKKMQEEKEQIKTQLDKKADHVEMKEIKTYLTNHYNELQGKVNCIDKKVGEMKKVIEGNKEYFDLAFDSLRNMIIDLKDQ